MPTPGTWPQPGIWNLYRLTPVTPPDLPRAKAKKLSLALEGRPQARRGAQAPPPQEGPLPGRWCCGAGLEAPGHAGGELLPPPALRSGRRGWQRRVGGGLVSREVEENAGAWWLRRPLRHPCPTSEDLIQVLTQIPANADPGRRPAMVTGFLPLNTGGLDGVPRPLASAWPAARIWGANQRVGAPAWSLSPKQKK